MSGLAPRAETSSAAATALASASPLPRGDAAWANQTGAPLSCARCPAWPGAPLVLVPAPVLRDAAHALERGWGEGEGGSVARPQIAWMFVRHPK